MRRVTLVALLLALAVRGFAADTVDVWLTTQDGAKTLTQEPPIPLGNKPAGGDFVITLDPAKTGQEILGLGASWEHSTCENLFKLPEAERLEVIRRIVSPVDGIGMNLMRLCIGSSDFIGEPYYTYCDLPEGQEDPELARFSIEKDRAHVLPVVKASQAANPDLLFFASCWSAPAWMKTTGKLGGGKLRPECHPVYAKYLIKFIQAYEAEGIPIHAITVQNEPHMIDAGYPTTLWSAEEMRDFIRDHLGPLFRENGVKTLIWCWDHNWNKPEVPRTILSDPQAAQCIDGTGFHHYEGKVEAQSAIKAEFPDKHIYFTEGSVFRPRGAVMLANILRNWSRSYNAWVVMLDEHRKPNRGPHSASATIIELKDTGAVEYRNDYYLYGQFMKFIPRGAVRVESDTPEGKRLFSNAAFRTPGGKMVLVVANAERNHTAFSVRCGEQAFDAALPAGTVATYVWTPARQPLSGALP